MKYLIRELSLRETNLLKKHFQSLVFNFDFDLVYESQVPNIGVVLLNGNISFMKKKKVQFSASPYSMMGISMLLKNEPSEYSYRIMGNSEVIIIQKSIILEVLSDKDSELYTILRETVGSP